MTQQAVRVPRLSPPSRYRFRWEQDSRRRVLKLAGVIDSTAASQLEGAIINLGARRLVIDLSDVTSLDPAGAVTLLEVARRLAPGRVSVVIDPGDEAGVVLSDLAAADLLRHPV